MKTLLVVGMSLWGALCCLGCRAPLSDGDKDASTGGGGQCVDVLDAGGDFPWLDTGVNGGGGGQCVDLLDGGSDSFMDSGPGGGDDGGAGDVGDRGDGGNGVDVEDGGPLCGNGVVDPGEQCDGDDLDGQTCALLGHYGGELFCTGSCGFNTDQCWGYCGDGVVQGDHGEECDDGVNDGVYGCLEDCGGPAPKYCGDGVVQGDHGEECDGDDLDGQTCALLGHYGGDLSCTGSCGFNTDQCWGYCGDGVVQDDHGEECDGDDLRGLTCQDFDYQGGTLLCGEACQLDFSQCARYFPCGEMLVDSRDDQEYTTGPYGSLCWMTANLNVGVQVSSTNYQEVSPDRIEKYCFNNLSENCLTDGAFYQWDQAMANGVTESVQGICPKGWWLPSDREWMDLEIALGMTEEVAARDQWRGAPVGRLLKVGGGSGFEAPLSGLVARPNPGTNLSYGYFWTSTKSTVTNMPWRRCLTGPGTGYDVDSVGRWDTWPWWYGLPVRCVTSLRD